MSGTIQNPPITSPFLWIDNIPMRMINGEATVALKQGQYVVLSSGATSTVVRATDTTANKIIGVVAVGGNAGGDVTINTDFCRVIKGKLVANAVAGANLTLNAATVTSDGIYEMKASASASYSKFVALTNGSTGDIISIGELKTAVLIP